MVKEPTRIWDDEEVCNIMKTCIMLHSMIVEDERGQNLDHGYDFATKVSVSRDTSNKVYNDHMQRHIINMSLEAYTDIRDAEVCDNLRRDIKMHVYKEVGMRKQSCIL